MQYPREIIRITGSIFVRTSTVLFIAKPELSSVFLFSRFLIAAHEWNRKNPKPSEYQNTGYCKTAGDIGIITDCRLCYKDKGNLWGKISKRLPCIIQNINFV
jgi:hypothetical protein